MTIIAQVSDWLKSLACFQLQAFCVQQNRWGGDGKIFQNKSINIMIFYCLKKRSKKAEAAEECLFLKIRILEEVEILV